jgi:sec-independent protein translocase protein TatC
VKKPYDPESRQLPLREHFAELRARFLRSLLALGLATAAGLGYSGRLLGFLLRPVTATYFFAPGEAFAAHLRVAFVVGWPLAWPVILYQAFAFASPGLYPHERRWLLWLLPVGTVLFAGGIAFGYLAMLPVVLVWLTRFASEGITPALSVSTYTAFAVRTMVPFGLTFQLPLVVAVLARAGVVTVRGLAGARRWVILGIVVLAALLTPPDVVSQVLMAVPMVVLFEISVVIARFAGRAK